MEFLNKLHLFSPFDIATVTLLLVIWLLSGWRIENPSKTQPSVAVLMTAYRHEWMVQFVTRQPRMFDSSVMNTLRQGTTFFASACMISIGGGLALIGNTERLSGVAQDLTLGASPAIVWEIKILLVLLFVANAFLKFVWSHRLFGYCLVVMASVPNDPEDPNVLPRARQAADINITAARSFNRGIRSVYFGLASVAWLAGPLALVSASVFTGIVLMRREFASQSRAALMQNTGLPEVSLTQR